VRLLIRLEQYFFTNSPADVEWLANILLCFWVAKAQLSKQDHVQEPVVESLLVESLTLLQVDDLTEVENRLDDVKIKFAEDWMVVMQAEMANIHLHLLTLDLCFLAELLANLKEAFLDFTLHAWLELLLHVVQLQVLAFEVLEWVALLLCITRFHVFHDRLAVSVLLALICVV